MNGAKMSILGLYKFNNHLLDNLYLPAEIDAERLKNQLLFETSEFEVLYPDYYTLKEALENYSYLRLHAWETMAKVLNKSNYDPFTNVSRHEERTETEQRDLTHGLNGSNTGKVSAFNSNTFQNQNLVENIGTETDKGSITRSMVYDLSGDSAISDTQDLIRKEIELRSKYDLYKIIVSDIKQNFCLMVY